MDKIINIVAYDGLFYWVAIKKRWLEIKMLKCPEGTDLVNNTIKIIFGIINLQATTLSVISFLPAGYKLNCPLQIGQAWPSREKTLPLFLPRKKRTIWMAVEYKDVSLLPSQVLQLSPLFCLFCNNSLWKNWHWSNVINDSNAQRRLTGRTQLTQPQVGHLFRSNKNFRASKLATRGICLLHLA